MNPAQELLRRIHGRQYRNEMLPEDEEFAKKHGLVVIFGASDDLVELRGAVTDEIGAYGGTEFDIDFMGVQPEWPEGDSKTKSDAWEYFKRQQFPSTRVLAEWLDGDSLSWSFSVIQGSHVEVIGHFVIYEDDEQYCRGIIIELPPGPHK